MSKIIYVDFYEDGEIKIETEGFTGPSCVKESEFLKEVLGKETHRELKPVYYSAEKTTAKKYLPICG